MQIETGRITGRLLSLKSLSQEYGISHITAEKALAVLEKRGPSARGESNCQYLWIKIF